MSFNIMHALSKYRPSFIPVVSVLVSILLLVVLGSVLGKIKLRKVEFEIIPGVIERMDHAVYHDITHAGLWWLLTTYVLWVVAIIGLLVCFFVVRRSLKYYSRQAIALNLKVLVGLLLFLGAGLFLYNKYVAPVVSAQDLIRHINLVAEGSRQLVDMTQGLSMIVILFIFVAAGYVLVPEKDQKDIIRKVKLMNVTLYVGSAIILVWLLQSRMLYYYSATLLVPEQKALVQSIAPTISLVAGAVASICLFVMYVSAIVWLQARHALIDEGAFEDKSVFDYLADEKGPVQLLFRHFSRVLAVIIPVIPGALEMFVDLA